MARQTDFYDSEFTSLTQSTTLISIALTTESSIYYIPMDLCTWMSSLGHDPNCDRVEFAGDFLNKTSGSINQAHNALFDARVSLACYQRLMAEMGSTKRR